VLKYASEAGLLEEAAKVMKAVTDQVKEDKDCDSELSETSLKSDEESLKD